MSRYILGISAFYHDSAIALIKDGGIEFCAQEERFSRIKNDSSFPSLSLDYLFNEYGIKLSQIDHIVFYDKPFLKFERLLETYAYFAPFGIKSFVKAIPIWMRQKLFLKQLIRKKLKAFGGYSNKVLFSEHHLSHAASAFYPSPFKESAILTIDGVGEWATTTISKGVHNQIEVLKELHFPHSLGLFYSAFTYYCGFKVNSGEYKLMGLAPYGDSESDETQKFIKLIEENLIDIKEDGSFLMNMDYFNYPVGLTMAKDKKWLELFGIHKREAESHLDDCYMNLALACQKVTEKIILMLAKTSKQVTGSNNLVLAGGVALNCVANGLLLKEKVFENIWIQPAAGDAGGSLGAALAIEHIYLNRPRSINQEDSMQGAYLGPTYNQKEILEILKSNGAHYHHFESNEELTSKTAKLLADNNVIGWFQDRAEFGPRALGNRSILANPLNSDTQKKLNLKIKFRESFRPFAPSVLLEDVDKYFDIQTDSPYMLLVAEVKEKLSCDTIQKTYLEKLYQKRSSLPAITHIDYSARIQTVDKKKNPLYWKLINQFKKETNCSVIVNTSFNVRGEPIVLTPKDAFNCFMKTDMDALVIGPYLLYKHEQLESSFSKEI